MQRIEKIVGLAITSLFLILILFSVLSCMFRLLFRDGRGLGLYGSRGEFYMTE